MTKINWTRWVIGVVVATVIMFLSDGVFHEHVVHPDWEAVYSQLGAEEFRSGHGLAVLCFLIFELGRGMISLLIYVLMRPFHGAGPKTAVLAAIAGWIAFSVTGPAQFIPLGFFTTSLWIKVAGFHLVTSILAILAGAAIYKDAGSSE